MPDVRAREPRGPGLPVVLVLLVLATAVTGCGSSDDANDTSSATAGGPAGALTAQEKQLMLRAAQRAKQVEDRVDRDKDFDAAVAGWKDSCDALRDAPTDLLRATYTSCLSQASLIERLVEFGKSARSCEAQTRQGDFGCISDQVAGIAQAAGTGVKGAGVANRAADVRQIRGDCAKAVGVPRDDVRVMSRIAAAADEANRALAARDPAQIRSAFERLEAALDSAGDTDENPVALVRACRSVSV